ncbi:MAG: hypothetical protein Q7T14_10175 [Aestuariivirga sp.]|nr:hypothetical protein [Aestuariivirga sp.]
MKTLATIALLTLGLTVSAVPAYADDNDWGWQMWGWGNGPGSGGMMGQGMMGRMAAIDSNNDGIIGDDEAAAQVESVFAAMDGDGDGELTEEEYMSVRMGPGFGQGRNEERQKAMQERKKARFAEMDTDKSGNVSQAEFIAGGKARFQAADTDKDGKVTPWEFRSQRWQ